jgi:predicted cupin superfamily sugar epimerase
MMEERIQTLIQELQLKPHPEGGYYSETYRAEEMVQTQNGNRNLMTVIYFLLTSKDMSRFHVIASDEHWFHHEGADLSIHVLDESGHKILKLGRNSAEAKPQQLVQKQKVFGSTLDVENSFALVSCVVAPGFDFADFKLLTKEELHVLFPTHASIIEKLGC